MNPAVRSAGGFSFSGSLRQNGNLAKATRMAYTTRHLRTKQIDGKGERMKRMRRALEKRGVALRAWLGLLARLAIAQPATARVEVDFNPNLDFSQFKTYAYIGGVEHLVMMQLNPELINDRVHRAVQRELSKKGLREVQPNENLDLVVRYWASSQVQLNVAATGNWVLMAPISARIGDSCTTP
jgi:Domain of unknown function (DUF4136)